MIAAGRDVVEQARRRVEVVGVWRSAAGPGGGYRSGIEAREAEPHMPSEGRYH
jgi:hypothetical protein